MSTQIKTSFLFYTFTLFLCLNSFFLPATTAQVGDGPAAGSVTENYTFETINVPGIDFLALTASSDFEDYAGYTKSADGDKEVAFTLIDGVFTTYDFPGAQNTHFYALGNDGRAAGYYEDSEGLHHGVILEDGELRQYDFPDAVQTEIYGISDATGVLTGNWVDAAGVQRGFTGDTILEFPGAIATFADFVNSDGNLFGSYIDADGLFQEYAYSSDGRYVVFELTNAENLEFFYVHGVNDALVRIARGKVFGDVVRTYLGTFTDGLRELKVPDSVSTQGYNINQDGSVVGFYETLDGRRHGFIAKPIQVVNQPVFQISGFNYTYESIDVPGVDFLALTASSDFEDYAGYTKSTDGEKMVAFTLIDGVFKTYDYPGSQNTYFYALGNNGMAAGYYEDSEGRHRGIILQDGEFHQYDFPGSVETEIWGISDATGNLTGNWTDASGVRRGFTGDIIVEYPGAVETYADFINALGGMFGSYVDDEGTYTPYLRAPDGRFVSFTPPTQETYEFFFVHGFTDTKISVSRGKVVGEVTRTYVGTFLGGLHELKVPGSVRTEGYNINQDASVVGHYDSPDGRRHGFIARLGTEEESDAFSNAYTVKLSKGLNMLSVPLAPWTPMTAKSLAGITGATVVIALDAENQQFIGWTPSAPNDGFTIEGSQGYIVNVPETRNFAFVGAQWSNQTQDTAAAPTISKAQETWAFVVSGQLQGTQKYNGYHITVRNTRTNTVMKAQVSDNYFAAATADLSYGSVVQVSDALEVTVTDTNGNVASEKYIFKVTPDNLTNAVLPVTLDSIGQPNKDLLLQNYPNPFNPETWIPYQLSAASSVSISIYDVAGGLVRTLSLGHQSEGFYHNRGRAAYWDGRNSNGEQVASGIYFYQLTTTSFQQTRRLIIVK